MKIRKLCLLLIAVILAVAVTPTGVAMGDGIDPATLETKTISEIGAATIAGTGAYYDDGMLKYANSGNTIGYVYDQSASLLEFDIVFDYIQFPAWFSMTFKASGFDRTQSPNLAQKGYSIVVYASGAVEVWKDGLGGVGGRIDGFAEGTKYRFKVGVFNDNGSAHIYFNVDGVDVVNAVDTNNPYLTGSWFNLCGDGGTSARLFSTKTEIVPDYYTYTLSTLGNYPVCTDIGVTYDKSKNVSLYGGTVGWNQGLQSCSIEVNMNWNNFGPGANVWVAMRSSAFDRANSPAIVQKGYVFRIGVVGVIEIYKNGALVTGGGWAYQQGKDYVFEFGTVDLDENRTMVFINVNGQPVASFVDDNLPIQSKGWFTMNGDGIVDCNMSSVSTRVTPLMTKVNETDEKYVITTYFHNVVSHTEVGYADLSTAMLDAIKLNGNSVIDMNKAYYAGSVDDKERAVDVRCSASKLVITLNKALYKSANGEAVEFDFAELLIKKTGASSGFICPSGYQLKQTYQYIVE